jgi:hypothetical protein
LFCRFLQEADQFIEVSFDGGAKEFVADSFVGSEVHFVAAAVFAEMFL